MGDAEVGCGAGLKGTSQDQGYQTICNSLISCSNPHGYKIQTYLVQPRDPKESCDDEANEGDPCVPVAQLIVTLIEGSKGQRIRDTVGSSRRFLTGGSPRCVRG